MNDLSPPFDQSTLTDRVYNAILEQLMNHRIRPGKKLNEEALSSLLGVSRTPVREALQRLAADGLVDFYPRCGASAKEITPQDITELYDLRRCLEIHAARRALGNIPEDRVQKIDRLIESCRGASGVDFIEAELQVDCELHGAFIACCGNSRLTVMLEKLKHLATFMRILHFGSEELARENLEEHENIWKAVAARDEERMAKLMEEHLDNRQKRLLEHFHLRNTDEEAAYEIV
ncbi:MAG: GntR family transcriptional regulator [Candidatus Latescibacter sp.]|nr:GntR family transcriptional regulator [Candidatus Latescibacter sp.]